MNPIFRRLLKFIDFALVKIPDDQCYRCEKQFPKTKLFLMSKRYYCSRCLVIDFAQMITFGVIVWAGYVVCLYLQNN